MIAGIGVDLCNIGRISKFCESDKFCRRVFTEAELAYAANRASRFETLAGMFAAKEAFAKATGLGMARMGLKNVAVLHDERGRPKLCISPDAEYYLRFSEAAFHLSISHDRGFAVAMVVYEC